MTILTGAVLLAMGVAGWALGRRRPVVNVLMAVLSVFAAITAHSGMQSAFVEGRLDAAVGDPRGDAFPGVILLIAGGEAVGLWLPFLLVPWSGFTARLWVALYSFAAATLAAIHFYFPFDLAVINNEWVSGFGPPYLLAWVVCLPLAGIGYVFGWMKSMNEAADAQVDA